MAQIEKRVLRIIKRLDAAAAAMNELMEISPLPVKDANDSRMKLRRDLLEFAGYLEQTTWWRSKS